MQKMSLYTVAVPMTIKSLQNLKAILGKAKIFAETKKIDEEVLLQARLALDQFPFVKQVRIICDNAKGTAGRLANVEVPKMEDDEKTLAELETRIEKTIAFVSSLTEAQFEGSEERKVPIYFLPGKYLLGFEYVTEMAMPNFYFHLTTAYSILRHYGLELGKGDFLGNIDFKSE
ncbi:MAG: DUF1993 domain-containing protein [Candidatus Moraniibacteriota bacterium]